ncbi:MAG: glycosyltransferase, partial [Verrucomicrobiota bacterium]|nr:glycosyltransferase [Verrucomicrobiota bacterium]
AKSPDARFRFLGTMINAEVIRAELGTAAARVELISEYEPDELPGLLSDCTAGAFPSYVEGFGLAVLEQLAAGLPTVAFDTPGPRDLLAAHMPEMLVASGDVEQFSGALARVLSLPSERYNELSRRSATAAAAFSWPVIARDTIRTYEELHAHSARPIVFVQPFSLGSAGGGARILRALVGRAPLAWQSVCSSPEKPKPWQNEKHLRSRPAWGRLEHTRLAALPNATARVFAGWFRRRLKRLCVRLGARALHAVPHAGLDFAEAHAVARELSLPFFLSLHDDLAYTTLLHPGRRDAAMATAWREAAGLFVISEALGREYCRRYGERKFQVVTDGVEELSPLCDSIDGDVLRIYFMGLFHMAYERNLRALLDGIRILREQTPSLAVSVTLRCEHVRAQVLAGAEHVVVLPFADEAQVQRDIQEADLLYMPIPFGDKHANFARYSLSTKMVTYAGSGVPILYHGPTTSAAFELLNKHDAALTVTTLDAPEIAASLTAMDAARRRQTAANALDLARREFMLCDQLTKFWSTIAAVPIPV